MRPPNRHEWSNATRRCAIAKHASTAGRPTAGQSTEFDTTPAGLGSETSGRSAFQCQWSNATGRCTLAKHASTTGRPTTGHSTDTGTAPAGFGSTTPGRSTFKPACKCAHSTPAGFDAAA